MPSRRNGFALPLVLLMGAGLLFLAVLSLRDAAAEARRERAARLHEETRQRLRLQLPALAALLEERLGSPPAASGLRSSGSAFLPTALNGETSRPLYSRPTAQQGTDGAVHFVPFRLHKPLKASWLALPGDPDGPRRHLAFAFEDLGLGSGGDPPAWYPLPGWALAPVATAAETEKLHRDLFPDTLALPLAPGRGELRFLPEAEPPLAPVLRALRLRVGMFAAGALEQREKEVRMRFFMEGVFWNPWNRPLRLHDKSGRAAFARVALTGLPAVRIENRTRGRASGWLAPDEAANAHTGKKGLSAWVEGPAVLAPGESFAFTVPDPRRQAEGLARTVHPAFPAGPADAIRLEWKSPPGGVNVTLLPFAEADPVAAARAGEGWLRWEALPMPFPELVFSRADEPPGPFFLHGGSLSFRWESAQIEAQFAHDGKMEAFAVDPRQQVVNASASYPTPAGSTDSGAEWIGSSVRNLRKESAFGAFDNLPGAALFSYPDSRPFPHFLRLDQPHRTMPFRLGAPEAAALNQALDHPAFPLFLAPQRIVEVPLPGRESPGTFLSVRSVNSPSAMAWREFFRRADRRPDKDGLRFPLFTGTTAEESLLSVTNEEMKTAATGLAARAREEPVPSVAAFHSEGRLPRALAEAGVPGDHPAFPLLAVRAFAGTAPPLVRHGPAWILHVAVIGSDAGMTVRHSARVWLQKVRDPESGEIRFTRMRFQWTNPEAHLAQGTLPPTS